MWFFSNEGSTEKTRWPVFFGACEDSARSICKIIAASAHANKKP
jgi:hypothetical protein